MVDGHLGDDRGDYGYGGPLGANTRDFSDKEVIWVEAEENLLWWLFGGRGDFGRGGNERARKLVR